MLAMKCGFMRPAPLTSPVPSLLWLTSASTTCWTPTDHPDIASMGLCFGELRVKHYVHLTSGKTARVSHLLWSIHQGTQNVGKTGQPFLHLLVLFLSHLLFLPVFPFSHPLHPSLPPSLSFPLVLITTLSSVSSIQSSRSFLSSPLLSPYLLVPVLPILQPLCLRCSIGLVLC